MSEEEAQALASQLTGDRYWFVEDVFQTVNAGRWCVLLRHRYDTPTQFYIWERTLDTDRHIEEAGISTMQEYDYYAGAL